MKNNNQKNRAKLQDSLRQALMPIPVITALLTGSAFAQNSYTFTSCGVTGKSGPNQAQVNSSYSLTNLNGSVTSVSGIQNFTVPSTGPYRIDVYGASGGTASSLSGYGARIAGDVTLTAGSVLSILVGQMGSTYAPANSDGGGGGSFVVNTGTLLFVAGGGAGAAQTATSVQNAVTGTAVVNGSPSQFGSSGASYSVNGSNFTYGTYTTLAQAFTNGGGGQPGGQAPGWPGSNYGDGGFGGGGSSCSCSTGGGGGGGGFIGGGGGACCYYSGFGGSSYLIPSALNTSVSVLNTYGNGMVVITQLCAPAAAPTSTTPPANQSICPGGSASLMATGSGTINWYNSPTSTLVLGTGTAFVTSTLSAGNYTFYAAATNTCGEGAKTPVTVTVNAAPSLSISGGTATVCPGAQVNLTASGADTYTWNVGGNTSSISPTPTANTAYTVMGTSTLTGCSGNAVTSVSVFPLTNVQTAGSGTACPGQNTSLSANGGNTFTWQPGNLVGFQVVVNPTVTTVYTVTSTDANNCTNTATASVNVVVCTGISANSAAAGIHIYPNPNNGEFFIESAGGYKYVVITDISGRIVKTVNVNSEKVSINISDLSSGVYYVKIQSAEGSHVARIIRQ